MMLSTVMNLCAFIIACCAHFMDYVGGLNNLLKYKINVKTCSCVCCFFSHSTNLNALEKWLRINIIRSPLVQRKCFVMRCSLTCLLKFRERTLLSIVFNSLYLIKHALLCVLIFYNLLFIVFKSHITCSSVCLNHI